MRLLPSSTPLRLAFLAALVAAASALCAGCVEARRRTVASVDDYTAYRRFRTASSLEDRLAAGYQYLRDQPQGAWISEIRRWSIDANAAYFERVYDDLERLRGFLDAVPQGPESDAVAARIVELELDRQYRHRKQREFDEKATRIEARLAAARAGRQRLVNGFLAWVKRLSSIAEWGGRTHELDDELIHAYRLTEPAARCTTDRCTKTVSVGYAIPEDREIAPRLALYDVVLDLEDGGVAGAAVIGPELFNRLAEAVELRSIPARSFRARTEALGRVTLMLATALESRFPAERCEAEAVSPVLLRRMCHGVEVLVIAAIEPSDEDRVVVRPVGD